MYDMGRYLIEGGCESVDESMKETEEMAGEL